MRIKKIFKLALSAAMAICMIGSLMNPVHALGSTSQPDLGGG